MYCKPFIYMVVFTLLVSVTHADVFGTGTNQFSLQFIHIGSPGNVDGDPPVPPESGTELGGVGYNYRIGKHEISIAQFNKALMMDSRIADGNEGYWNDGVREEGTNAPASFIDWFEAARFANWLTSGDAYEGAYQFYPNGNDVKSVDWFAAVNTYGTVYVIPSTDEWYKAAYYKPIDDGTYSLYASGLDSDPIQGLSNGWNYLRGDYTNGYINYLWEVELGGVEQHGTRNMTGNIWEWGETQTSGTLESGDRLILGGGAETVINNLKSNFRHSGKEQVVENKLIGLRIASIGNSDEEPGAYVKWSVSSEYGNPIPSIGTNLLAYGTLVTNGVEASIDNGSTQYVSLGTSDGILTNWFVGVATNNTDMEWEWGTNYWVSSGVSGSGSVSIADGWYGNASNVSVAVTPDSGWLFMGWSGDLSGDYTISNQNLVVDSPKEIFAAFSIDADDDGLSNSNEWAIGSDPRKSDSDGDNFGDFFEVANGGSPTNSNEPYLDYIREHPETFGLYASNVVLDVAVGQVLMAVSGTNAELTVQLLKSDDLVAWTNAAAPVEWSLPLDSGKQFLRVRADP